MPCDFAGGLTRALPLCSYCSSGRYFNYYAEPNGCTKVPDYKFKHCCDEHDMCYTSCLMSKTYCDDEFYNCMIATCDYEGGTSFCYATATTYHKGVRLTCMFYNNAQMDYCECLPPAPPPRR
jgi:hypothetical protein